MTALYYWMDKNAFLRRFLPEIICTGESLNLFQADRFHRVCKPLSRRPPLRPPAISFLTLT